MKTMMFSVFDSKAAIFGTPFFMLREQMAIRAITDMVNDPETMIAKHPEDFSLYHLGVFDDENGDIEMCKPRNIATASSLVKPVINEKNVIDLIKNGKKKINEPA